MGRTVVWFTADGMTATATYRRGGSDALFAAKLGSRPSWDWSRPVIAAIRRTEDGTQPANKSRVRSKK